MDNSTPDARIQLVDEARAEPLVCELQTQYGVRRKYYKRLPGLFRNHSGSDEDVVPHINQVQSQYDAAHFEAHLHPEISTNYTLCAARAKCRSLFPFLGGLRFPSKPLYAKKGAFLLFLGCALGSRWKWWVPSR